VQEREDDRIAFGCSVLHAFAHEWKCQLEYNPRLIEGFGLSNGEGLERIWSDFAPLIPALRVSTKAHRRSALAAYAFHHNQGKLRKLRPSYAEASFFVLTPRQRF
jgi:hypothetical protein